MLSHASVVDSQKLVSGSGHVNVEMLSFGTFLVHESKYRVL